MQGQGIQTLLDAEKEANVVVQKARQYRLNKIKEARTQSQNEIEALKAAKNEEFAEFEAELAKSSVSSNVDAETDIKIKEINDLYQKNKSQVVEKLLGAVANVKPEPHINFK